jgi:hypothetical protein
MTVGRIFLVLSAVTLLSAGCLFDHTAEQIAEMRKAGNLEAAKTRALEVLGEKPKRMDVWRELALCDVALCRASSISDDGKFPNLAEAALICAAVSEHEKGNPDDKWVAAANMTASQITNSITYLMTVTETKKSVHYYHMESLILPEDIPEDIRNQMQNQFEDNERLHEQKYETQSYLDPDETRAFVRKAVVFTELLKRLPCDNPKLMAITLDQVDRKIESTTWDTNLTSNYVNAARETALGAVHQALQQAESDLDTQGYFDAASILENKTLE